MPQVPFPRIRGPVIVVAEVLCGHDAERSNSRQRPTLRAPQPVFPIAGIVDDLSFTHAWQGQAAGERFAGIGTFTRIAFTIRPSNVITVSVVRAITVDIPIDPLIVVLLDSIRA